MYTNKGLRTKVSELRATYSSWDPNAPPSPNELYPKLVQGSHKGDSIRDYYRGYEVGYEEFRRFSGLESQGPKKLRGMEELP